MRLTTKGRYAVTAMLDLALHEDQGPITLADISMRQGVSISYLEQLFAKLRRGKLVESVRGPGGGYRLAGVQGCDSFWTRSVWQIWCHAKTSSASVRARIIVYPKYAAQSARLSALSKESQNSPCTQRPRADACLNQEVAASLLAQVARLR